MTATRFEDLVRAKVDEFLQTVVMVDDEALRPAKLSSAIATEVAPAPTRRRGLRTPLATPAAVSREDLDPARTAKVFADNGLACAILSPQTTEENRDIIETALKAAKRADLVVLDWMLNGDEGRTTLALFERLLAKDLSVDKIERRLRVVAVYTGEVDLARISDKMQVVARKVYTDERLLLDDGGIHFSCGPVRVAVFAKEDVPGHEEDRVTIGDLPDRLSEQFCQLCSGLLAVATLTALTGIRQDAHRLLTAMGAGLDPAFFGHRVALPDPEEAERHLEELIVGEMAAIVGDIEAGSMATAANIDLWLQARPDIPDGHLNVTWANRERFLTEGLGDDNLAAYTQDRNAVNAPWGKKTLRKVRAAATELFTADVAAAALSNRELFERMKFRTLYSKPHPTLRLGTVVRFRQNRFAICVQPVCDSVRLTAPTPFLFLTANLVADDERGDDIYVTRDPVDREQWITLKLETTSRGLFIDTFTPSDKQIVVPHLARGGRRTFLSAKRISYQWIAELRVDQAQRVAEKLGTSLSRVGLNDPEVLRSGGS